MARSPESTATTGAGGTVTTLTGTLADGAMRQEFQERLLDHILRVVAMPPEEQRESVDRGPVLSEQVDYRDSRIVRVRHSCSQRYNARGPGL